MNTSRRNCVLRLFLFLTAAGGLAPTTILGEQMPQVRDQRLQFELFAKEPDIVTPTGTTIDRRGRLLVIESHTHQRPKNYKGPAKDRIRIIEDTDGDGQADRFRTFFEGTEATMSLASGPGDWIYVATRMKVFRIRDTNDDDLADEEQTIVQLETRGNYPHNGLSGLAVDGKGGLYFGMGENLGAAYRLIGSDGAAQRGSGEGGVFHCDEDGKHLVRIATGFWNPFGICIDPHGRIFAVGNDADGRPPCRLVHVVETGDYGFQFRYGRSGRHPLQAWNGELPGTLPMVAGTGEAPCEIAVYQGRLWVASWGHNRIERYELLPVGASFRARREIVVQGDHSFRPVGIAHAPDGSLYFTDWVDKSYPVHGKGRIWRLSYKGNPPASTLPPRSAIEDRAHQAAANADWEALKSDDGFLRQSAVAGLVHSPTLDTANPAAFTDARQRLGLLQALRWKLDHSTDIAPAAPVALLRAALADADANVRLYAIRWVADAKVTELRSAVEQQMTRLSDSTPELFHASIATLELLDKGRSSFNPNKTAERYFRIIKDETKPSGLRVLALRMIPPGDAALDPLLLRKLLSSGDGQLRRESVRLLALSTRPDRFDALANIATEETLPDAMRADAIMGLSVDADKHFALLKQLAADAQGGVSREAARGILRHAETKESHKHPPVEDLDAWLKQIGTGGDADAGWRVFFGEGKVRCANCHRFQGRGANTGPDLTAIAARTSRRDVLQSILSPSREMAPRFVPSTITTTKGRVHQGLWQGYDDKGDRERFLAADGSIFQIDPSQIESRHMATISIMPEGIQEHLSISDIRNLLALLSGENN